MESAPWTGHRTQDCAMTWMTTPWGRQIRMATSARFSPTGQIDPVELDMGYNTQFNARWPVPTYDVMYPTGPDPEYPDAAHSLNSWDWEYLRQQLLRLPSTGPTATFIPWTSLAGNQLRSFPVV